MNKFLDTHRYFAILIAVMVFNLAVSAQTTPQRSLPAPTGPNSVGRTSFDWIDPSRADDTSPSGHLEIVVWVWYPASPKAGDKPAGWMPGKWAGASWSLLVGLMPQLAAEDSQNPLRSVLAHSYSDAPMASAQKKYPILLFDPGLGAIPLDYATLIEDLASHGYVVAGVVPTHYAYTTVFCDGRVLDLLKDGRIVASEHGINFVGNHQTSVQMAGDWAQDTIFTLNQLEKLDKDAKYQFKRRLDFSRVGVLGHSMGGATSLEVAKEDSRVRAAVNVDGAINHQKDIRQDGGVFKPLMVFNSQQRFLGRSTPPPGTFEVMGYPALLRDGKPSYHLVLMGSTHGSFMDFDLLPVLPQGLEANRNGIDPARALSVTSVYLEAFFGQYLEDKSSPLLNGPSPEYPEVTFESNKK